MRFIVLTASLFLAVSSVTFSMSVSAAFVICSESSPGLKRMVVTQSRGRAAARFALSTGTEIATIFEGEPTARAKVLRHREILDTSPVYSPAGEAVSLNDLLPSQDDDESATSIVVFLRSLG